MTKYLDCEDFDTEGRFVWAVLSMYRDGTSHVAGVCSNYKLASSMCAIMKVNHVVAECLPVLVPFYHPKNEFDFADIAKV